MKFFSYVFGLNNSGSASLVLFSFRCCEISNIRRQVVGNFFSLNTSKTQTPDLHIASPLSLAADWADSTKRCITFLTPMLMALCEIYKVLLVVFPTSSLGLLFSSTLCSFLCRRDFFISVDHAGIKMWKTWGGFGEKLKDLIFKLYSRAQNMWQSANRSDERPSLRKNWWRMSH